MTTKDQPQLYSFGHLSQNFEALVAAVTAKYNEDRLFQAHFLLESLEKSIVKIQNELVEKPDLDTEKQIEEFRTILNSLDAISSVKREHREVLHLLNEFDSNDGWTFVKNSHGVTTHYKIGENSPLYNIRIIGEIHAPFLKLLCCLSETDLFHKWIPMISGAQEIKSLSRWRKLFQLKCWLPYPFSGRDMVLYGYGVDILEQNTVICVSHSIDKYPGVQLPEPGRGIVRADIKACCFMLKPIAPDRTQLCMLSNLDVKLPLAPFWLVNFVNVRMADTYFTSLRNQLSKFEGSEYATRLMEKREMYDEVERRINAHFDLPINPTSEITQ